MEKWFELLQAKQLKELRGALMQANPYDISEFLEELNHEDALLVFRILPKDISADVFAYLNVEQQSYVIRSFSDTEIRALIDNSFMDDTADFLDEVPAGIVNKVLKVTDAHTRRILNQLLLYPEDSAGSLMTTEFVSLQENYTVRDSLDRIRRTGVDKETIYTCYVIDNQRVIRGTVALRALVLATENVRISDIMESNVIRVHTHDDQEYVSDLFRKYDFMSMPVVDNEDRLVGIITIDDIVDVMEEEATEDIEKMAALTPSEDEYMRTPVFKLALNRIPWLLILMISATFTGMIIMSFEEALASMVILSSFIPMLMDTGGNCGSQASTLVIRGLALGDIRPRDILKILSKELRVASIVGGTLAMVNFVRLLVYPGTGPWVALTVSLTMLCTVLIAKSIGCTLPIGAKALGLDPALMASPLITTIVDALTLIIYFNFATRVLTL